jgi:hypothetical protein
MNTMKPFRLWRVFFPLVFLALTNCEAILAKLIIDEINDNGQTSEINGDPSPYAQEIYDSKNLNDLCLDSDCEPTFDPIPDSWIDNFDPETDEICGFDYNPNATSQFLIRYQNDGVNGLNLLLSKEDLFFMAWASMRHHINPHFLVGVMAQESYGNCAAVSSAGAEGCFQITTYYGRLQLEASYPERVADWFWADQSGYYPDTIFIDPLTWFGEEPETDQFRQTLDPTNASVLGTAVSSVVNFPFGVIGSGLYYNWEQNFLYNNYASLNDTVGDVVVEPGEKAVLLAAAYNGGIGRLTDSLTLYGTEYLAGMDSETQDYVEGVTDYCIGFQAGSQTYDTTYSADDVEYLIDLLSQTYPADQTDWSSLKSTIHATFFADVDELRFSDDIKALIYVISTYDVTLAPEIPEDVID